MSNFTKTKIVAVLFLSLAIPSSALAASEMELRMNWADTIGKMKKNECKNESTFVKESIETAAALIFHGEYDESKETLEKGMAKAKSEKCKKAMDKNKEPDW